MPDRIKVTADAYVTIARRRWPNAAWIIGEGPYASVSSCHHYPDHEWDEPCSCVTVMLFEDHAEAAEAKAFIDKLACGGCCTRDHKIVNLAADLRRADLSRMGRDDRLRAQFAQRLKAEQTTQAQQSKPTKTATNADWPFQEPAPESARYYLYRYFDACGCLLYVGITDTPDRRDREHKNNSPWHALAVRREVAEVTDERHARDAERKAVQAESPAFNSALRDSRATNKALTGYLLSHAGRTAVNV